MSKMASHNKVRGYFAYFDDCYTANVVSFLTILGVHLLAVMTPGPDFLIVSKTAVSSSRRAALLAAAGVTVGVMLWAALALVGLHLLFERIAWLQIFVKIAGGAYLLYLGIMMFKASLAKHNLDSESSSDAHLPLSNKAAFRSGLLTNLANPKAAVYFGSVFATFLTQSSTTTDKLVVFSLVSLESLVWFSILASLFSLPAPRRIYRRAQKWIDRVAGVAFAAFGLRLVLASQS